jgi:hypothetical protein
MAAGNPQQRQAVLSRLREILVRQKEAFGRYLDLLALEEAAIRDGDVDRLQAQLGREKDHISEIHDIKAVMGPLFDLYTAGQSADDEAISALVKDLDAMKTEMKARNGKNRAALQVRMETLKNQITGLRVPPRLSPGFGTQAAPILIDVSA